jgi:hypothetical protein
MIDKTLDFILDELNGFLEARFPSSEPHAVLSSLANQDGSVPPIIENKLILSLVNVERETTAAVSGTQLRAQNGAYTRVSPSLNLNLFMLVSAHFGNNYAESLKFLSSAVGFFQAKPMYSVESGPGFPRGVEKLTLEMMSLDFQDLNNLWGNLGGNYLPSVVYKVRTLTVQEAWIIEQVPAITGTEVKL